MRLSADPRDNALFVSPDVETHEDEVLSPDEEREVARMETECEERAQAEIDAWYEQREREQEDMAPDTFLDAMYEDRYAMYEDDPNPYAGTYSEE
jgi:hypothetical protein